MFKYVATFYQKYEILSIGHIPGNVLYHFLAMHVEKGILDSLQYRCVVFFVHQLPQVKSAKMLILEPHTQPCHIFFPHELE